MPPCGLVMEQLDVIVTILMREGIVALCLEWRSANGWWYRDGEVKCVSEYRAGERACHCSHSVEA